MGLGVAILPLSTCQAEVQAGSLVVKPFAEGPVSRPIGLLIRKGKYLDRASAAVLDAFKQAVALEE
jgi:LysR family transcriptional regulator, transcriptional activator of the cysJI operon